MTVTAVEAAQRVLQGIRVPSVADFEANESDYLPAHDVETVARDLIERWPELAPLADLDIRYGWKKEGSKDGEAGYCKKLSPEVRYLTSADFFVWLAADYAREMSQRQLEALVYHELCHAGLNAKGKPVIVKHDVELFYAEVRRYGAWHERLEGARQVFEQAPLPL
jgi:hypothetical protein